MDEKRNFVSTQRVLGPDDMAELLLIEKKAWPNPEQQFSQQNFESQMEIFPEGLFGVFINNQLAGMMTGLKIKSSLLEGNGYSWYSITDDGNIRTHQEDGDVLFVASLSVSPDFKGLGLGKELISKAQEYVQQNGLSKLALGARLPGYASQKPLMSISEYYEKYQKGEISDWQLKFYESCGLEPKKLIDNYFEDEDSANAGVLMEWTNPDLKKES